MLRQSLVAGRDVLHDPCLQIVHCPATARASSARLFGVRRIRWQLGGEFKAASSGAALLSALLIDVTTGSISATGLISARSARRQSSLS
jgi:hypothetical protein